MCARCTCGTDVCPHGEPGRCPPEEFGALADVARRRRNVVVPLGPSDGNVVTTEWSYRNGTLSRHGTDDSYEFSRMDATPGDRSTIDLDMTLVTKFPRTDAIPGEKYVFGLDSRTVPNSPPLDATPGDR